MEQKIFQGHADHFDGLMDSQVLVEKGYLQKVLEDALLNDVVKRYGYPDVTYLKYCLIQSSSILSESIQSVIF